MRVAGSTAALAIAALLGACTGTSGSGPATAGFQAGAGLAGLSQHVAGASVRKIALGDDAMLYWQPLPSGVTDSSTPAIISAFVSLSEAFSGLPCDNCVGNPANPAGLGIAFPEPYLPLGSTAEETYTFEDLSVTESCTLKFQFKQNNVVLATNLYHNISIGPGEFFFFQARPLPSNAVAGPATTTGDMVCPGVTTKAASETVYFH